VDDFRIVVVVVGPTLVSMLVIVDPAGELVGTGFSCVEILD
jgi:hypothetical protein